MTTWPLLPTAYRYRPLKKGLVGFDIYGLQRCLIGAGYSLPSWGADGQFGSETSAAVRNLQGETGITVDGIAGAVTQRVLVLMFCRKLTDQHSLPDGLIMGQIESESAFQVGNYTAPYDDGTRDIGLVQRNRQPTDEECFKWFDGPKALAYLASDSDRGLRPRHDRYYGKPGAKTHEAAWKLAAGSWNQPSVADAVAAGKRQMTESLGAYIGRVCSYVVHWTP